LNQISLPHALQEVYNRPSISHLQKQSSGKGKGKENTSKKRKRGRKEQAPRAPIAGSSASAMETEALEQILDTVEASSAGGALEEARTLEQEHVIEEEEDRLRQENTLHLLEEQRAKELQEVRALLAQVRNARRAHGFAAKQQESASEGPFTQGLLSSDSEGNTSDHPSDCELSRRLPSSRA
jgi:hypothetical protein